MVPVREQILVSSIKRILMFLFRSTSELLPCPYLGGSFFHIQLIPKLKNRFLNLDFLMISRATDHKVVMKFLWIWKQKWVLRQAR
jgi:hypothetical protein